MFFLLSISSVFDIKRALKSKVTVKRPWLRRQDLITFIKNRISKDTPVVFGKSFSVFMKSYLLA